MLASVCAGLCLPAPAMTPDQLAAIRSRHDGCLLRRWRATAGRRNVGIALLKGRHDMSREILVVTPENIEIEYELGGIGTRFLAHLVDVLMQVLIFIGGAIVLLLLGLVLGLIGTPWAKAVTDFFQGFLVAARPDRRLPADVGLLHLVRDPLERPDARQAAGRPARHPGRRLSRQRLRGHFAEPAAGGGRDARHHVRPDRRRAWRATRRAWRPSAA